MLILPTQNLLDHLTDRLTRCRLFTVTGQDTDNRPPTNAETEISARWIVRLCQKRNSWEPFPLSELQSLYVERFSDGFTFNKLIDQSWIKKDGNMISVTAGFIVRCYESSPANNLTIETKG